MVFKSVYIYKVKYMSDLSIIIVAGGRGVRMGSTLPKQYLMLHVKPILIWTIEHIHQALSKNLEIEIIVVRPKEDEYYLADLLKSYLTDDVSLKFADGGKERAESVQNGLALATGEYVAIHDGVRPFVTRGLFNRLWEERDNRSVIPALVPFESTRVKGTSGSFVSLARSEVRLVQTPQLFERSLLVEAYKKYQQFPDPSCTDDSSIVEKYCGVIPQVIEGEELNLKVTTPKDLAIAEMYLQRGIFQI